MNDSKSRRSRVPSRVGDMPRSGIREFFDIVSSRKGVVSLAIGEPDFATPWHIREASVYALDRGATSYTSNSGLRELRLGIAEYVARSYGVRYDPETEILITVGVSQGLDLSARALLEPGDEVIYHEPCYVAYGPTIAFALGKPVPVRARAEDNFRVSTESLERAATERTRALLINFPTNPTGAALSRSDAEAIAAFATGRDLVVISDEIYSELTYEAETFSFAALPGMKDRTVLLKGFSKAWAMTGFRVGFACAPPDIIEAMTKIHQYTMLCAPTLSQKAAVEALRNGPRATDEMKEEYRRRRNYAHAALKDMGLPCMLPQGAFYLFPSVARLGMSSAEFAVKLLDEENVACVPGGAFGPSGEGFIRCSFAASMADIKEAMKRMASFVARLSG